MYPILLQIGKLSIYTYGFFVGMGLLAGIYFSKKEAERLGEDQGKIMDLFFYLLVAVMIGSRLFYVATNPEKYMEDPVEIFRIWNGGLVFYGGFIGGLAAAIVYIKKKRMPLWQTLDILAPGIAAAQFLGRIGCFFAGCCYGKTSELPWAIIFTHPDTLAPAHTPLHPTQLYAALTNLIIFCILWMLRGRKRYAGQLFWIYAVLYGVTRAVNEIFRGDFRGTTFFGIFSISQVIGGAIALFAIFMMVRLRKKVWGNTADNARDSL